MGIGAPPQWPHASTALTVSRPAGRVNVGVRPAARVELRRLSAGQVAWTHHVGPCDGIGAGRCGLDAWAAENGRQVTGPPREVYLKEPMNTLPEELLTEVAWPAA